MVDRYWQKIESVENNIEKSIQIESILLKLKGYDEKLGDLLKIGNNENNISSNLGKININETNISSNLGKINTNKNNIDEINENLSNIDFNSNNKYSIENFFIYNIEIVIKLMKTNQVFLYLNILWKMILKKILYHK